MNSFVNIFSAIFVVFQLVSAVQIKCTHKKNHWTKRGNIQECLVEFLEVTSPDEVVTDLNKHDYTTIKSFFIHKSMKCLYMPKGVEKFLDSLEVLVIAGTKLQQIKSSDLSPFEFLKEIYMNDNEIQVIEGDLFKFNPDIMTVNFEDNYIKQIGCGALEPLIRLEEIRFRGNPYFSKNALKKNDVEAMKIELREKTCDSSLPIASALTSNCPVIETTTKSVNCELSQTFIDLRNKIESLELELNRTQTTLIITTREFCERYQDHNNEKCKETETTTKIIHPDDEIENFIETVVY